MKYSIATEKRVGKGKLIVLGTVIGHSDLIKLVNLPPIAEASNNVQLVQKDNGIIIAVETHNENGYVVLNGNYINEIDGKTYCGKVDIAPYTVKALKELGEKRHGEK